MRGGRLEGFGVRLLAETDDPGFVVSFRIDSRSNNSQAVGGDIHGICQFPASQIEAVLVDQQDWGKLISDVPSATATLDQFLHHAEMITITGKSYRLRNKAAQRDEKAKEDNKQTCKQ